MAKTTSLPGGRALHAGPGGGVRVELTRARRGQSGAHNGTFPPGVSCQSVREHGAVARGAAALWSGREKQAFQKLFPSLKRQFSKGFKAP